jgi:hypothetical protein
MCEDAHLVPAHANLLERVVENARLDLVNRVDHGVLLVEDIRSLCVDARSGRLFVLARLHVLVVRWRGHGASCWHVAVVVVVQGKAEGPSATWRELIREWRLQRRQFDEIFGTDSGSTRAWNEGITASSVLGVANTVWSRGTGWLGTGKNT